ncbi:3-dehydroquinate synthase [Nesterenkonia halobia]|uniref:3-dehydroquinate synthase n=1 Tax=Nesterenkonia halobia TaxID=37922 RepID=A0ABP6RIC1_9MICC
MNDQADPAPEPDQRPQGEETGAEQTSEAAAPAGEAPEPTTITVGDGGGSGGQALGYDVVVGNGLLARLPEMIGTQPERVLVIHPRALRATGDVVREDLENAGYKAVVAEIPDAEEGKHIQVAAFCWQVLGQNDFTRSDAVVSVGGGAVTDVAGFVAATWLRGVRVVHMPTTLLGMVDAAVGGKTGINTAEGKNLVGSFHQPAGVLADLDTLLTLPRNELVAGLAEVVKCGFISDERILEIIEEHPEQAQNPHSAQLRELIERAIAVKAAVVGRDPKEAGLRESLNYGHTLAHAIELAERYQWRHGAAVSVGLVYAAELARSLGRLDDAAADRHRSVLQLLGLPTTYRDDRWNQLLEGIRRDKKNRGDQLRFVLLSAQGQPATVEIPDASILYATYQEIAEPETAGPVSL